MIHVFGVFCVMYVPVVLTVCKSIAPIYYTV